MTSYLSKVISISRFPMICGVVMIHSQIFSKSYISLFCGEILGRICVPFFFLISGYLFFQGYDNTIASYRKKLSRRVKTILIPYLLWNLIAYIVYAYGTGDMQPSQFLESFWIVTGKSGHSPADGPLWFLRTLIFLSVISPVLYVINRKRIIAWISPVIIIAWLFDLPGFHSGMVIAFCWFNLGAWLCLTKFDKAIKAPTYAFAVAVVALYIVMSIIELYTYKQGIVWFHNCVLIMGMLLFFVLPKFSVSRYMETLGGASFFMYCLHEMVIRCIQIIYHSSLSDSCNYLIIVIMTIILCVLAYYLLGQYCPRVLSVLTGSRQKSCYCG